MGGSGGGGGVGAVGGTGRDRRLAARRPERPVLEMCLSTAVTSLGMIMAGTGDLECLRVMRELRARVEGEVRLVRTLFFFLFFSLFFRFHFFLFILVLFPFLFFSKFILPSKIFNFVGVSSSISIDGAATINQPSTLILCSRKNSNPPPPSPFMPAS